MQNCEPRSILYSTYLRSSWTYWRRISWCEVEYARKGNSVCNIKRSRLGELQNITFSTLYWSFLIMIRSWQKLDINGTWFKLMRIRRWRVCILRFLFSVWPKECNSAAVVRYTVRQRSRSVVFYLKSFRSPMWIQRTTATKARLWIIRDFCTRLARPPCISHVSAFV